MKQDKAIPSIGVKDGVIYASDIEDGINKDFGLCEKIAASYNETYGKGYNPSSMDELYKALELFTELHETGNWPGTDDLLTAKTALTNAKTIKK